MKFNKREIHRKFAYFYVGLIVSFAFSGILNNHRNDWNIHTDYTYETKDLTIPIPLKTDYNSKKKVAILAKKWHDKSKYIGYRIRKNKLRAFYQDNTIIT